MSKPMRPGLAALTILFCAACGSGDDHDSESTPTPTATPTPTPTPIPRPAGDFELVDHEFVFIGDPIGLALGFRFDDSKAGDLVVAAVRLGNPAASVTSIGDTQGSVFVPVPEATMPSGEKLDVFYVLSLSTSGENEVVVHTDMATSILLAGAEFSGGSAGAELVVATSASGTGTAISCGGAGAPEPGVLHLATAITGNSAVFGSGAGMTILDSDSLGIADAYTEEDGAMPTAATFTNSAAGGWACVDVRIRP